ncbi:MAG: DUF4159 domain-containing protein [Alphaproteobacteria bacterium]|nr:DUF4159 domain-containing protein [Alphaproteobacteria bacterium]MCD8571622.1 DUF4159 domain-containing protein [Alphaproteobacteria bacterium]
MKSVFTGVTAAMAFSGLMAATAATAQAQTTPQSPAERVGYCYSDASAHMGKMNIGYVKVSPSIDDITKTGMERVAKFLEEKTSLEATTDDQKIHAVELDIERDDICQPFYPFIYWPVTHESQPLSADARLKVDLYLSRGGFIMFDLRDAGMNREETMQKLWGKTDTGIPLPRNHILRDTFYSNSDLPCSININPVNILKPFTTSGEAVSQVIILDRNCASAWAGITLAEGSKEQLLSLRGITNIIMYALTGDYKNDQRKSRQNLQKMHGLEPHR